MRPMNSDKLSLFDAAARQQGFSSLAAPAPARSYPVSTDDDLSKTPLWAFLTRRQREDALSIEDCVERDRWLAECLAANGCPALPERERIGVPDLFAAMAAYLATLADAEPMRDWGGLTSREVALSELTSFLRWACRHGNASASPEAAP